MSLSVLIKYRDPSRADYFNGFCHQSTLRSFWWPVAKRLGLETLQRLEVLHITDRAEAEQLVRELKVVQDGLRSERRLGEEPETARYILNRLSALLPAFEASVAEWDQIEYLSL